MICVCWPLQELYANAKEEVTGLLQSAHQWVDMSNVTIQINSTHAVCNLLHSQGNCHRLQTNMRGNWLQAKATGCGEDNDDDDDDDVYFPNLQKAILSFVSQVRTCKPALGHSFAAGTTDGGGDLNFTQGNSVSDVIQMSATGFDLTSELLCLSLCRSCGWWSLLGWHQGRYRGKTIQWDARMSSAKANSVQHWRGTDKKDP